MELSIDIETFSSVSLIKSGVYPYTESPDYEILLFGYGLGDAPTQVVDLAQGEELPEDIRHALTDPDILKTAFNAAFEMQCISTHFGIELDVGQWECSMVKSAMLGFPLSLDKVAQILQLPSQKMREGKLLIRHFCVPCKATKTNAGRTRNLPQHDAQKWELFKEYNKTDVDVERAIRKKIAFFELPEQEKRLWELDQKINRRGVYLDQTFVHSALQLGAESRSLLLAEAVQLTGLDNPNSLDQLKDWLSQEMDEEVTQLRKEDIPLLLEKTTDSSVKRLLELRQELGKSSIKKYVAMQHTVCRDGRIRGLLQFYGANRTGRWSGRLVQTQNLPQNHLIELELARDLIREKQFHLTQFLFGSITDTLSQLIRTAFVAAPGHQLYVADFSAIEARVLAWWAKEKWRMEVFNTHGKIYEASAATMFGVPIESVTKGSDLRKKGKVSELACIAENELVLTDKGLVPIQEIQLSHFLWDGIEWVRHSGVVFKGIKKVINYEGLRATTDHLVWVKGQEKPISFGDAAASGAHLLRLRVYPRLSSSEDSLVKVYDILHAGPRNRFTVSGVLVHNCGYQGAVGALIAMGALKGGLKLEELPPIIQRWRAANKCIVNLWYRVEQVVKDTIKTGKPNTVNGVSFYMRKGILCVRLPSGRSLAYIRPRVVVKDTKVGRKEVIQYEGLNDKKKWAVIDTYGGKIVENCSQAIARDCLGESLLRLDEAGYSTVFHVHDEAVIESPIGYGSLDEVCQIMGAAMPWAPDLPLRADGFVTEFYKKD